MTPNWNLRFCPFRNEVEEVGDARRMSPRKKVFRTYVDTQKRGHFSVPSNVYVLDNGKMEAARSEGKETSITTNYHLLNRYLRRQPPVA